ncbi:MAG: HAMP domain-containing histidine kinase [Undibacterium sp.]|nr:HAMP domain-containing histidine kinase [Undibacterium sp.]
MTINWRFDTAATTFVSVVDDSSEGGKSIASLNKDKKGAQLICQINSGYQWPFCEMTYRLSADNQGVDLTKFERLRLRLRSEGPEKSHPVRVFIRNYNPAYSSEAESTTLKPHEIVYDPNAEASTVELKLSQFMVASWWVQEHPSTIEHMGPELDHVTAISFVTSGLATPGLHKIQLESAELIGPWISAANFRLGIIFVWIVAILAYLFLESLQTRQELRQADFFRNQLRLANEVLETNVEERTRALAASNSRLIDTLQNLEGTRQELVQIEKNAALGSLVSGIAHELNTPIGNAVLVSSTLSDMITTLELASDGKLTKKILGDFLLDARSGTSILQKNLERAAVLISSFKQISADQHSEQRRIFNLADVAEDTALAMAPTIRQTKHTLDIIIPPSIALNGFPGALSQIFMNFVNNALLHAFEDIAQGHMRLTAAELSDHTIEIVFSDDGNGIPAHILRRVFEPFFTTKLGRGGSGLGMHLAHNVVTKVFGGKIEINSTLGQGTTIRMLLPLVAPSADENSLNLGAPNDVLDDYALFLGERAIEDITTFSGPHSRRDVVELALFIRTTKAILPNVALNMHPVDSYAAGIEQLRSGVLDALATTSWASDLEPYQAEINISSDIIQEGQSQVGIYSRANNVLALSCKNLQDFSLLRIVSNRDWSADWNTLHNLGNNQCVDIKTWRQMVYMVSSGEVDALLAPFPNGDDLQIEVEGCKLVPIPNIKLSLCGSRHFAANKNKHGLWITEQVFPELKKLVENGSFAKAMSECGFFNQETKDWTILNAK